jgi:protoporphyrinogen oxidase
LESEIIDYPIESNLWQLSVEKQVDYLISLIQSGDVTGREEPSNYEQWIRWKLGECITDKYMIPYNKKIWGVNPEDLDIDWLHKIPQINTKEILESCLRKYSNPNKMPSHNGFYYPKSGGFQTIFDSIHTHLKDKVILENKVNQLDFRGDHWNINNVYKSKNVINTAPWNYLYEALEVPQILENDFSRLKNNSVVVSLWEKNYDHDWHWCYDPNLELEYHREFYIHNFAPHSLSNGMYTETNIKRWAGSESLWSNGERPIYEYINPFAYPIPIKGHSWAIKHILNHYESQNLFGVGRWGQWQYLNSDVCIWEAIKFINSKMISLT